MKDTPTDKTQIEPTQDEIKMLEGLRKNPIFAARMSQLIQQFEEEISNGMNAHEAEEALINSLQELGGCMMSQWAISTQDQAIDEALLKQPSAIKHSKKNFNGIAPLD